MMQIYQCGKPNGKIPEEDCKILLYSLVIIDYYFSK
jgi:hypothetical protein